MKLFAKNSFAYNAVFMFVTTFVFVAPLAILNNATKPLVDQYWATAKRIAILATLGIPADKDHVQAAADRYHSLEAFTVDAAGKPVAVNMTELEAAELAGHPPSPLYYRTVVDGETRIAGSFTGLGLWSAITLAIGFNDRIDTIIGLQVLVQAETPGLGGRIVEPWFMDQFKNKSLASSGPALTFVTTGPPPKPEEPVVDGIAGATITANGVRDIILAAVVEMKQVAKARGEQP